MILIFNNDAFQTWPPPKISPRFHVDEFLKYNNRTSAERINALLRGEEIRGRRGGRGGGR